MDNEKKKFIGTWELVEWAAESSEGEIVHPLGKEAIGLIRYGDDGSMVVMLMKKERPIFKSEDPLQATPEEVMEAYDGFLGYSGTFEVDEESTRVIHRIEFSSFPNWVGEEQSRNYEFNDDQLILSTPLIGSFRHKLIWKKKE